MMMSAYRFKEITVVAFAILTLAIANPTVARERRTIDATPFSHSPCSVLSDHPCTPYYCSPLNRGPCIPEIDYPYGQNLQLTILSKPADSDTRKYEKPERTLDTIGDLFAALRACWRPPAADEARDGMQMSVKFSLRRDGSLIAPPRLTYATPGASAQTRDIYLSAIASALEHCTPLPLSKGLGNAIAGRPIMIRYVDNRVIKREQ